MQLPQQFRFQTYEFNIKSKKKNKGKLSEYSFNHNLDIQAPGFQKFFRISDIWKINKISFYIQCQIIGLHLCNCCLHDSQEEKYQRHIQQYKQINNVQGYTNYLWNCNQKITKKFQVNLIDKAKPHRIQFLQCVRQTLKLDQKKYSNFIYLLFQSKQKLNCVTVYFMQLYSGEILGKLQPQKLYQNEYLYYQFLLMAQQKLIEYKPKKNDQTNKFETSINTRHYPRDWVCYEYGKKLLSVFFIEQQMEWKSDEDLLTYLVNLIEQSTFLI